MKALLTGTLFLLSANGALGMIQKPVEIDLGQIQFIEIVVECENAVNRGLINDQSIIERFRVIGSNEDIRSKLSGSQCHDSYPLFVRGRELRMWKDYPNESAGDIVLGTLESAELPSCVSEEFKWYNVIKVKPAASLRAEEIIRKEVDDKVYRHSLKISNNDNSLETLGYLTGKVKMSKREAALCDLK